MSHAERAAQRIRRTRALGGEFPKDLCFVIAISQVQRARALMPDPGSRQEFAPDFQTARREIADWPKWLADRPEHAEIPDRCPRCPGLPLENGDAPTAPGQLVSMGQSQDTRSDHGIVVGRFATIRSIGLLGRAIPWEGHSGLIHSPE